ncbi:hypothetical protein [Sulfurovum sp. TSL1]|uniref:hypothetical protein n=1 Tax=Sulfurovum sp. TSL1 TaxID=2826994 RepID=UPI001CC44B18|nr:hypothetical protein [Sulfurovum sp. TSL1]GIT98819.1 hypothetical protein TSL1_16400 [Sulfurovum sp. TSL1]
MQLDENYIYIFEKKYPGSIELIQSAIQDEYHLLWYLCKDFAAKMLTCNPSWQWLGLRIDDFSLLATQYMCKRLPVWIWRSNFELGSLCHVICSIEDTVRWLANRWVSTLKNLFDPRYSYHISPSFLTIFDEAYMTVGKMQWES